MTRKIVSPSHSYVCNSSGDEITPRSPTMARNCLRMRSSKAPPNLSRQESIHQFQQVGLNLDGESAVLKDRPLLCREEVCLSVPLAGRTPGLFHSDATLTVSTGQGACPTTWCAIAHGTCDADEGPV